MKKIIITLLALAICANIMYMPAAAASIDTGTNLVEGEIYNMPKNIMVQASSSIFLSNGTDSVQMNAPASVETRSPNNYITDTQQIKVSLKSSKSITVKVSLYRLDGSYVVGTTKDLGTIFSKTWTFTNLNQGDTYYFTVTNLGQQDVTVSGKVSD